MPKQFNLGDSEIIYNALEKYSGSISKDNLSLDTQELMPLIARFLPYAKEASNSEKDMPPSFSITPLGRHFMYFYKNGIKSVQKVIEATNRVNTQGIDSV
jgi:hypothetical protein